VKTLFIRDLIDLPSSHNMTLFCWLVSRRETRQRIFVDLADSTGKIQGVLEKAVVDKSVVREAKIAPLESALEIQGVVQAGKAKNSEIAITDVRVVGTVSPSQKIRPRAVLPGWPVPTQRQVDTALKLRHLYLRNPNLMATMRFRHELLKHLREWFDRNGFVSVEAPILTPVPLYEDETAVKLQVHDQPVFLTQCVSYYLEAAVHAFERVYSIGPSFRAKESESPRHLVEFWHVKAEVAWGNLDDIIMLTEKMILDILVQLGENAERIAFELRLRSAVAKMTPPYERIEYTEALARLERKGIKIKFGLGIHGERQLAIASEFSSPFWLVGLPAENEPFPYSLNPEDDRLTRTADLVLPQRFGELLGVAEKISDPTALDQRLQEKGKFGNPAYDFIRDVHQLGCAPHVAFGMGLERLIRWMLGLPHVRDAIAFPRLVGRKFYP